jgi:tetratricopeptide (TPR) repeat protein
VGNILTKYRSFGVCLTLALATAAVFWQVSTFDFINLDDADYIYENPNIQAGITFKAVKWAFTTGYACFWHPLTWLSHMLDWQLFGPKAGGHHLTNLIFHIANTLLLFIVLKQMTRVFWPSAFVAALFALHPLHVESVAWVSERKDVLSTFFWLLTMWAYVRYVNRPKTTRYLLVVVFLALGLMSKPMLVTLPFVLLLLDYWPLERFSLKGEKAGSKYSLSHLLLEKVPLFAMVAASCIVSFIVEEKGRAVVSLAKLPLKFRIYNASISYLQYIIKMIWPACLAFFYPHPGQNISILYAVISAGFLLAVTVFILRFAKDHRYLVTGWFWYLGTLVPVIGIIQVGRHAMADRYSYITLTGLFIIIAWGLPELLGKWPYRKIALWASSLMVLSALAVLAYLQQRYWKDTITLCEHVLKVTDNNYEAHFCMTEMLCEQGRIEDAIGHCTEAIRIAPTCVDAINNLGFALYKAGRIDEAIDCYKRALEINPRIVKVYTNLGFVLCKAGKIDEAIDYYKRALEINPRIVKVYTNLGAALIAEGKFDEAISLYNKALQTEPDSVELHIDLGYALKNGGRLAEAVKEYEKVLLIQPQNANAHNNLGVALVLQGKLDEAIEHFNQAIRINPNYTAARSNLTNALSEKQKLQNKTTENLKE